MSASKGAIFQRRSCSHCSAKSRMTSSRRPKPIPQKIRSPVHAVVRATRLRVVGQQAKSAARLLAAAGLLFLLLFLKVTHYTFTRGAVLTHITLQRTGCTTARNV